MADDFELSDRLIKKLTKVLTPGIIREFTKPNVGCDELISIHIFRCASCYKKLEQHFAIAFAARAGSIKSEAKARASRANGAKGGRPKTRT